MKPLVPPLLLALLLTACAPAPQPQLGVHVNTRSGQVSPSVATNLGGVSIAASGAGGRVGTRIAVIGLSAGF